VIPLGNRSECLYVSDWKGNIWPNGSFLSELPDDLIVSVNSSPSVRVFVGGVYQAMDLQQRISDLKNEHGLIFLKMNNRGLPDGMRLCDLKDSGLLIGSGVAEPLHVQVGSRSVFELSLGLTGESAPSILLSSFSFLHSSFPRIPIDQISLYESGISVSKNVELRSEKIYRVNGPSAIVVRVSGFCREVTFECGVLGSADEVREVFWSVFSPVPEFVLIGRSQPLCFSGILSDCTISAILPSIVSRVSAESGTGGYRFKTPDGRIVHRDFSGDTVLGEV
jgi:hypothetical protein